jgi:hypothetical protein
MLALSIRQPWAWAIIHAGKDVENRSENMARRSERLVGQIILIHAGKSLDRGGFDKLDDFGLDYPDDLSPRRHIGSARIASVLRRHPSRRAARGQWQIVLTDTRPRPFRPWRGQLGFFRARRISEASFRPSEPQRVVQQGAQLHQCRQVLHVHAGGQAVVGVVEKAGMASPSPAPAH